MQSVPAFADVLGVAQGYRDPQGNDMPMRPLRPCTKPGCPVLHGEGGRCAKCRRKKQRQEDSEPARKEAKRFYNSERWRRTSNRYKEAHPLCERCLAKGFWDAPSEETHHIKSLREHPELAFDWDNLEALCKTCHGKEAAYGRLRE